MQPEQKKLILGYFIADAKEYLATLHQGFLNLQNLIDNREELQEIFRATFSLKGGANMLNFKSVSYIVYNLEKYLRYLSYIEVDQTLQKLFLDIYQILNNLFLQIETDAGLTESKALEITSNCDYLFTLLNSHLTFLKTKCDYKRQLLEELNLIQIGDNFPFCHQPLPLKVILVDPLPFVCKTYAEYFLDLPDVEIVNSYFEFLPFFDAVVTASSDPASADHIDEKILNFFGEDVIRLLQQRIQSKYLGKQPIGTALIVETNHALHPFLIHIPSLRMQLVEAGRNYIYQAIWTTLLAIYKHNQLHSQNLQQQINIVAFPGLGTGIGRLPITEAAKQISLAYRDFLNTCSYT